MKIENYKTAMGEIKMSESKYRELHELIDNTNDVPEDKPAKRIKRISVPVLAAAVVVLTVGGTVFAVESGGISLLKKYFDGIVEKHDITDMPVIEDAEIYGTEITVVTSQTKSVTSEPAEKESVKVVSAASDNHNLYIMIEYTADESELPENISDETLFGFGHFEAGGTGISQGMDMISRTGNSFSFVCHIGGIKEMPEGDILIKLEDFGYRGDDGLFVPISDNKLQVKLNTNDLNIQQSVSAINTAEVDGVEFEAQLSPLGMLLSADADAIENWELSSGEYMTKYLGFNYFMFFMKDGTVRGDGETYDSVYGLIRSQAGWTDFDNGKSYHSIGFSVPLDISEIECVSVHGMEFRFDE